MEKNILELIEQICRERKIPKEKVLEVLEYALAAAFRKDFGEKGQNLKAEFSPETGKTKIFEIKTVVSDLEEKGEGKKEGEEEKKFNPKAEIEISKAKELYPDKKLEINSEIKTEIPIPAAFGRIAAQTAKQVIVQRLKEIERNIIYEKFKEKEGTVVEGTVQKMSGPLVLMNIDNVTATLPPEEQIEGEKYLSGTRLKFYILSVAETKKEPQVLLSRRNTEILKHLFISEVPEIASGSVEIKKIVREPGVRSKVAVFTKEKRLDPVGAVIGQRGIRIQTVASALNNERIDVIEYKEEPLKFVANALSPAKVISVEIDEDNKNAKVLLSKDQMALAIGKRGLNLHLASELSGYRIELVQQEEEKVAKDILEVKKEEKNEA